MDNETAFLILKFDKDVDLWDQFEQLLFDFKNEFLISKFHPVLLNKKLTRFEKQIHCFEHLTEPFENSGLDLTGPNNLNNLLDSYNAVEIANAEIKSDLSQEDNPWRIKLLMEKYLLNKVTWWRFLAQSVTVILEREDVRETEEPGAMKILNQIKLWSDANYDEDVIQNANFTVLRKEIIRSQIMIEKYG